MKRPGRRGKSVRAAASGGDWESVRQLAVFNAANGWPFDFALMIVVYGLLRLVRMLLSPFRDRTRVDRSVNKRSRQ